jgi:hypothetical protein
MADHSQKGQVPERPIGTEKDNHARLKGRLSFFTACLVERVQMVTKQPIPGVSLFSVYLLNDKAH